MSRITGKRVTIAHALSQSLIDENDYPYSLRQALLEDILGGANDLVPTILRARQESFQAAVFKMHRYARNRHPYGLPTITSGLPNELEFLPVAVLMQDFRYFNDYAVSDKDKTEDPKRKEVGEATRKMLDILKIDADEVVQGFQEEREKEKLPGNTKPWDMYLHFGVPIDTKNKEGREYIYRYMRFMVENQPADTNQKLIDWMEPPNREQGGIEKQPAFDVRIQEADINGYDMQIGHSLGYIKTFNADPQGGIRIVDVVANVPDKHYKLDVGDYQHYAVQKLNSSLWMGWLYKFFGAAGATRPWYDAFDWVRQNRSEGFYDLFISIHRPTEDTYEVVLTVGLSQAYWINVREDPDSTRNRDYRSAEIIPSQHLDDPKLAYGSQFRVPIAMATLKDMGFVRGERVLAEALTVTIFLVQSEHIDWYQRQFWGWAFLIIAIVMLVWGQGWVAAWLENLGVAAATAANVATTLTVFAFSVATFGLPQGLGKLISWGIIIYSIISIVSSPSVKIALQTQGGTWAKLQALGWQTSLDLLNATLGVVKLGQQYILEQKYADASYQMAQEQRVLEQRQDELEAVWDELGDNPISAFGLVTRQLVMPPTERASQYYMRTLMTNPGIMSLQVPREFYNMALRLPEYLGEPSIIDNLFDRLYDMRLSNHG